MTKTNGLTRMGMVAGIMLAFILLPGLASAQTVTVYCDDNYSPYSYVKDGQPAGIYTEIFKKVFSRMNGYEVVIKPVPWKRGVNLMEKGKGFALYPPYYRPKVRPFMDYPIPVLDEGYSILTRKEDAGDGTKKWPEDFTGKKMGANAGFSVPDLEKAKSLGVKLEEAKNNRSNLLKLISGRIDGFISDKNAIFWELKQLKANGEYDDTKGPALAIASDIGSEQGYMGFTNKDEGAFAFKSDFVTQFVAIVKEMKASGEIQSILDGYIK